MKKYLFSSTILTVSLITHANETVHWGYDAERGPAQWGKLSADYKACSDGKNQTPINITNVYESEHKHPIDVEYQVHPNHVVFNGHTVQINSQDQSDYLVLDQEKYYLQQFHLHTPSENQIDGKSFPLELHFVNANAQGELTVMAVMFELGQKNSEWDKIWADLSYKENDVKSLAQEVDLEKLLPKNREYYRFSGSLTTPPCSEGVNWIVYKQPMTISKQQLAEFQKILKGHSNNRPIQPTHGRIVIAD
ncbi:carbonic anhydrase [Acinetobacter larvae]|uniref:Carbonic anhydrase n=1 Tax=Acinetobacter larvae TaxID=1789224 RepID=A0A1B2M3P4_9GAMM|nr:carbonic anhydrase [Acinetobacter larvae]